MTIAFRALAVIAASVGLLAGAVQLVAQDAGSSGYRPYQLQHAKATEIQSKLTSVLSSLSPKPDVVVDQQGNRLLVRGNDQAHHLTEQLVSMVDRPSNSPPVNAAPPSLKAYRTVEPLPSVLAELRRQYAERPDVRLMADNRTSQILVFAPADVHAVISNRITTGNATAPSTGAATPIAAPDHTVVQQQNALREPTRNPQPAQRELLGQTSWRLHRLDVVQLHAALERLVQHPLTTERTPTGDTFQFRLGTLPEAQVSVLARPQSNEVVLAGPRPLVDSWFQVIRALDSSNESPRSVARLITLPNARPDHIRQAVTALTAGSRPQASDRLGLPLDSPAFRTVAMVFDGQPDAASEPAAETDVDQQPGDQAGGEPAAAPLTAVEPEENPDAAGIIGDVKIEYLEGLDIIILRGNERDVARVRKIIEDIERLSAVTEPKIEIYPMQHVGSEAMAALVREVFEQALAGRRGAVNITPLVKPNSLLLIGTPENVDAMIELIKRLDQPVAAGSQFRVFPLKHASAAGVQATVDQFVNGSTGQPAAQQPGQQPGQGPPQAPSQRPGQQIGLATRAYVVADTRSNALIVRASPRDMIEIAALVKRLDTATSSATNELKVFTLKNSLAEELVPVLREAINMQPAGAAAGGVNQPGGGQPSARTQQLRSTALQFMKVNGQSHERIESGILTDVRITADARANAVVVTGPAENMELIGALIQQLDQIPAAEAQLKVFAIANGDAFAMVEMLEELFGTPAQGGQAQQAAAAGPGGQSALIPLRFSVDERTNSIVASGMMKDLAVVEAILLRLDESDISKRKTEVYRLQNVQASEVATAVNEYLRSERQVQEGVRDSLSPFEQIEQEVVVVPEDVSNSLIVSTTPRFYEEIKDLVEKLDERPPMVMVQVLIAEVGLRDVDEFGVELGLQDSLLFNRSLLENIDRSTVTTTTQENGSVVTVEEQVIDSATLSPGFNWNNFPLGNSGSDVSIASASNVAGQALSSFAVGRTNPTLGYGGLVLSAASNSVNVLLRALEATQRLEVLSRPQVMMLNNNESFIQVGQRVPTIASTNIIDNVQTNTITYLDVGLILNVRARVNPDDLVVMEVDAEKSDLRPIDEGIPISINIAGDVIRSPIINITTAQTVVSALNGQTIVIGGLITKRTEESHRQVPHIGDIPLLGDLFRYDGVTTQRTELLIILTPRVVRSEEDAEIIKQVESSRMSWVLGDVIKIHGEAGLRGRADHWEDHETSVVYPDMYEEALPSPLPDGAGPEESVLPSQPPVSQQQTSSELLLMSSHGEQGVQQADHISTTGVPNVVPADYQQHVPDELPATRPTAALVRPLPVVQE